MYGAEIELDHFLGGIDLTEARTLLSTKDQENWENEVKKFPKLRTYITLKDNFGKESYLDNFLSKNRRSLIAQLRTGTSGRTNTGYNRLTEMASVSGFGFPQTDNRKFKCAMKM